MRYLFKQTWAQLTAYFLTGLFAVLPLVITLAIVGWLVSFISPDTPVGRVLMQLGAWVSPATEEELAAGTSWIPTVLGLIVVIGGLFAFGFVLVELGIRKWLGRLVDGLVARVPLIGQVYGTSKQLVEMLDKSDKEQLQGMAPVFCYFGRERNAGVLALLVSPQHFVIKGREYQIVVVPTAPVPFGGGMLFIPTELVEPAEMSVDGLMSIYISMGVTAPQYMQTVPLSELPRADESAASDGA
jgi:uncharacterized membrane protein